MRSVSPLKKDKIFTMRVAVEEFEAWQVAAEAQDMKLADWIRRLCKAAAAKSALKKR